MGPWRGRRPDVREGPDEKQRRQEEVTTRGFARKENESFFLCNEWHWWVITHQLHEEVQERGFGVVKEMF